MGARSDRFKNYFYSASIGAGIAGVATSITGGHAWYFWPLAFLCGVPIGALIAGVRCLFPDDPPLSPSPPEAPPTHTTRAARDR